MPPLITRAQVQQAVDIPTRDVEVPEWGGTVRVRGLNAKERIEVKDSFSGKKEGEIELADYMLPCRLIAMAAIDEQGAPIFSAEDVEMLGKKSPQVIDRLATVVAELSAMTEKSNREAGENLPAAQTGASSSS